MTIEPSNGQACLGSSGPFVCNVTGTGLAWAHNTSIAFFNNNTRNSQPLTTTIFTAHFLAIENGSVSSRIVTTEPNRVTRSLDGELFICRNSFVSGTGTVSKNITIDVTGNLIMNSGIHKMIMNSG